MTGVSVSVLKTLEKYGVTEFFEKETPRDPLKNKKRGSDTAPCVLNAEQQKAFEEISANLGSGGAHLLYGVTGSGKTHVFTALADKVLSQGKSVLLLLPEISLTLQIIDRLVSRYGDLLAVLHSGLSVGERYDEYKRIRTGDARFVVGTRSAVFAPLKDLGLVIVDEEQEHTYKSEKSPRYDAKAVAGYRVHEEKALLLVASATPSFESFYKAQKGRIGLSVLRERYNGGPLPKVLVSDMSRELAEGNRDIIGSVLASVGLRGTFLHFSCFLELDSYGRLFYNKVERLIAVNRDDDRKNLSRLVLRTSIELLAEVHDIDSLRTQCGTNRGRRIGGTTFDLQFNKCSNLFCHSFPWLIILFLLE